MQPTRPSRPRRILTILASVLIVKVLFNITSNYPSYISADFTAEFLSGREDHFSGLYRWAFFTHIMSGPITLILGLVLFSDGFRVRLPRWHRILGRIQVACVLLLVTPSGLGMSYHAASGPVGAVGLATLAVATAICTTMGARAAMSRRFAVHRRWMWRCYLLLCSTVVLRLLGGLAMVAGVAAPWFDPLAIWSSGLVPIAAFEWRERSRRRARTIGIGDGPITSP